jgi:site-specific recombinase XerD
MAISTVPSDHSKRAYESAIDEFIEWSLRETGTIRISPRELFAYQEYLGEKRNAKDQPLAPSTINVKMSAVRAIVHCAAAEDWITEEQEKRILKRVKSQAVKGRRQGQRMTLLAVQACLKLPDRSTLRGKRDYAILGLLFSCGLRRAELCSLQPDIIKRIGNGWALVDLIGKRRKVRSIPLEEPIKIGIDEWLAAAHITEGRIFRSIHRGGKVFGTGLSEMTIWNIIRSYAAKVGYENFAPHDARRTCARIYYDVKGQLPQIQYMLGHDKLDTTAKYVDDEQKFGDDAISKGVGIC